MQDPNSEVGRNLRAPATRKRSIMRTIRLFFLQGWAWYRGNYIGDIGRLAAFFAWPDIQEVQQKLTAKRTWWFERDRHFHLRRQDGIVHLNRPQGGHTPERPSARVHVNQLKLLTYNCQSLGHGSSRLQELASDMHTVGVTVAALQGTRWKSDQPRGEWILRGRDSKPLYHAFSWGRPTSNTMLGVQLLVRYELLQHAHVHTRFDPPRGLHGRLGGLRIVSRNQSHEIDELFVVAYAPQESDDTRDAFFQALLEFVHGVPKRTRVWLLGDFNAHVGPDVRSFSVGMQCENVVTNHNGSALVHACEASGLVLANTFCGGGNTWWSPDGNTAHCLDFIAVPQEFRSRLRSCKVNKVLGKRWQLSPVRDHWPVELVAMLPAPWVLLHRKPSAVRWNKHALQVALEDLSVGNAFLADCEQALQAVLTLADFVPSRSPVEACWSKIQSALHIVACHHFAMRPGQKTSKLLPATFDLLLHRRDVQQQWLTHVESWWACSLRAPLQWFFDAFRLFAFYSRAQAEAKQAVKTDE